jgi:signal transduction histidine kinase
VRVTDSPPEPRAADAAAAAGHGPEPLKDARPGPAGRALPALGAGQSRIGQAELAWLVLAAVCLVAIVAYPAWQVFPLETMWLIATIFIALGWLANRRIAVRDKATVHAESQRLVQVQRQFLQDASHQLRTPITIALGHAELLASALTGDQQRDIGVVAGELQRLKKLSERLLLVAAAESPDFLVREPADVNMIVADLFLRWQMVARRRWRLGRLDPVTAPVDADRLGLALDALVENAVRHTAPADEITLSATWNAFDHRVVIAVADTGTGIAAADLPHVFERFRTSGDRGRSGSRGTGLGLALVRAVAAGHGGDVTVRSTPGAGSTFELVLPVTPRLPSSGAR